MRYCFYSEYRDLKGGYTTLIITLIRELRTIGKEVILLNYHDGLIARELSKEGIEIKIFNREKINRKNAAKHFYATDIFIIPKFYEFFNVLMDVNPKIIYYDINDYVTSISHFKKIKFKLLGKLLIRKLLSNKSLIFMDDTGINNLKNEFNIIVDQPLFLPVSVSPEKVNKYLNIQQLNSDEIRVTYIGRSVDWKLYPLKKILDDASQIRQRFKFYILVDDKSSFEKYIDISKYQTKDFLIEIHENLPPSEISSFLINHSDIYFGMGTTALNAGTLGIPVILMDYSTKQFPLNYYYNWLAKSQNYSLGRNIEKSPPSGGESLLTVIEVIKDIDKRKKISEEVFQYVSKNHFANNLLSTLLQYCDNSTFRLRDAKKYLPYYSDFYSFFKTLNLTKRVNEF